MVLDPATGPWKGPAVCVKAESKFKISVSLPITKLHQIILGEQVVTARHCFHWTAFLCLLISPAVKAQSESSTWWKAQRGKMEVLTDAGPDLCAEVLNRIDEVRLSLAEIQLGHENPTRPMIIVAFQSNAEYQKYEAHPLATAYYLRAAQADYIVISQEADRRESIRHEYTHYLVHEQFGRLPTWLDEGLASVYSTIDQKDTLRIGRPPLLSLMSLLQAGLRFPLPALLQIRSEDYQGMAALTLSDIYSESWLLVHMLSFSPNYASKFNEFLQCLKEKRDADSAFLKIWNKSVREVENDLRAYLKSNLASPVLLKSLPPAAEEVKWSETSHTEVQTVLHHLDQLLHPPAGSSTPSAASIKATDLSSAK